MKPRKFWSFIGASLFLCLGWLSSCQKPAQVSGQAAGQWCQVHPTEGATVLGAMDYNAGYSGIVAKVREGERLVFRSQFPRSRYLSIMVYDQDFMPVDAITDFEIAPSRGVNPFLPGNPRSGDAGEFEVQVLMDPPPEGDRPANTLYAGLANNGKKNKLFVLAYRVYLPDQGLGKRDQHPDASFGGVNPPQFRILDRNGNPYCPSQFQSRIYMSKIMLAILKLNQDLLKDPMKAMGEPQNPPIWINNASDQTQRESTVVPNDDTRYLALPVSDRFGELLVLRWKGSQTPQDTFTGKPFPKDYEMRYWSLSFDYVDLSRPLKVYAEKTVADVDVPMLLDGTRQIVIGFNGIERPNAVPPEQWVSVKMKEGMIIMRNILITEGYAGDFGKIPQGKIPKSFDQFTPGGVYCSTEEFAKNPNPGLSRAKLLFTK